MGPSVVLERQEGHARAPLRAYFGVKHGGTLRQIADHLDMPPDCDYPMVDINNWRDSLQYNKSSWVPGQAMGDVGSAVSILFSPFQFGMGRCL